jgi:hypothetical protein
LRFDRFEQRECVKLRNHILKSVVIRKLAQSKGGFPSEGSGTGIWRFWLVAHQPAVGAKTIPDNNLCIGFKLHSLSSIKSSRSLTEPDAAFRKQIIIAEAINVLVDGNMVVNRPADRGRLFSTNIRWAS